MTTKELIIQELEQSSPEVLEQILALLQRTRTSAESHTADHSEAFWQAYSESEQEYEEVYQRLANS